MLRRYLTLFLIIVMALAITGTDVFAYKKIKVFMPQPPELSLNGVTQIAVLDFKPAAGTSRELGKYVADKLIENLLTENRGIRDFQGGLLSSGVDGVSLVKGISTKCYSVVERSRLESVLSEQAISEDGLVDDAQAAQVGKLLGVKVLLYGDVSVSSTDNVTTETRVSLSGNNRQEYQVKCQNRTVTVSANLRLVDTETGEILGTRSTGRTRTTKWCEGDKGAIGTVGQLAATCANGVAWEFANLISPWYGFGEFELEKIKVKEYKDEAEDAAKAAEELEIERAYAIYKKLYDADSYNPQFLYNMGIIYEVTGDFEKAKEMYDGAVMLKDEKDYKEAAERIAGRMPLISFYESIGTPIELYDFEAAASDASLLAKKITVKGGSDERIDVYEQPDDNSEVAAKVPGGIQFEVVEESGDYYLVKLLGGKQGYIKKDKTND